MCLVTQREKISTASVYAVVYDEYYLLMYKHLFLSLSHARPLISPLIPPFKNTRYDISNACFLLVRLSESSGMNVVMSCNRVNYFVIASSYFLPNL